MSFLLSVLSLPRQRGPWRAAAIACASIIAALPASAARNAERDGIGVLSLKEIARLGGGSTRAGTSATTQAVTIDPRRSLIVTEQTILSSFPILPVLNALAAGSPNSEIARQVYDQWWDLANVAPGIGAGPHCNDQVTGGAPSLNGFQFDCPRVEGQLVGTNPTDGNPTNSMQPIAIVNRFDLATSPAAGGTDCGEYRIVYAKRSGFTTTTNRLLIIFEGVLPNPAPNGKDLSGCKPVAQFWANLSTISDPTQRAAQLKTFFFTGLPGFQPVVKASHYGMATSVAKGQIRTNMFMQQNWVLREYHVGIVNNALKILPSTARLQQPGLLYDETNPNSKGASFRSSFLNAVQALAAGDINTFNMNAMSTSFDAGDGDEQSGTKDNLPASFARSPNFAAAIQSKLTAIGSTLTPAQIVARAQANTCAGCHQLSSNQSLGGGLTWPASLGFVHVSEAQTEVGSDGLRRFVISPALTNVFLPHRQQVLQAFLNGA
jgi:hypothetical protein